MAVLVPQFDKRPGLSGGADAWDDGLAGILLSADYFAANSSPPVAAGSHLKAWNGSTWTVGELKRWDGTSWSGAQLYRWNSTSWISVP